MTAEDRKLMARVSALNQNLGLAVAELMARYADEIPPEALRLLAFRVDKVAQELYNAADEKDGGISRVV